MSETYNTDAKRLVVIHKPSTTTILSDQQEQQQQLQQQEQQQLPILYNPISNKYWSETDDNFTDNEDPDNVPGRPPPPDIPQQEVEANDDEGAVPQGEHVHGLLDPNP